MIRAREVSRESPAGIETRPPPDAQRHAVHPRLSPARLRRKPFVAYASFGIRPYGIKAIPRCRSRNRLIGRELSIEYAALESGLSRFVHLDKGNFVERDALIAWQQKGFRNCFVTLEMVGIIDADARGSEPILANGCIVGRSTNGGYGWRVGKSLALAMVEPRFSVPGQELDIVILGKSYRAVVIAESPFDPTIPD